MESMSRKGTARRASRIAAIGALAVGALVLAGRGAEARPHGGGKCGGHGARMLEKLERDVGRLGLESQRLEAAYQVIDEARKQRRALDGEIHAAHERMRELLDQDQPSADAVTAHADTIGALTTQARKIELRAVIEVREMLSPEQRQQLDERRNRHARRAPRDAAL